MNARSILSRFRREQPPKEPLLNVYRSDILAAMGSAAEIAFRMGVQATAEGHIDKFQDLTIALQDDGTFEMEIHFSDPEIKLGGPFTEPAASESEK